MGEPMLKNVWEMTPDDVALIDGKRYKFYGDKREGRSRLGRVMIRTLRNVDDPKDEVKAIYGFPVEIERSEAENDNVDGE